MSRKQRSIGPVSLTPSPPHLVTVSPPQGLMLAWLAALVVARWLMPTEGAAEGLTLWLVQLTLFTAVGYAVWEWRCGEQRFRFDAFDGAIGLLILAQVVSALTVVFGVGNARAAINLAWEWIGSGVLIWMLRQELTSRGEVRKLCIGLSLTAGVLAGFGLWQHYVGFRELGREYDRLVEEHDQLAERLLVNGTAATGASASDLRRLATLRAEMARQQIPVEKSARQSLEQRVKRSSEPLGLFALANSFAGLLIVMGLIVVGTPGGRSATQWGMIFVAAMIGFCVVLTKSRTAWVGLLAGISWWAVRWFAARTPRSDESACKIPWPRIGAWLFIGAGLLGCVVVIAVLSGGLDRAVLSEAPKSLRYRLEYWQGTWATIREHFWLGTGPGNFRDYYLAHKLPESSEEIADPHNFVLDVWANAGTIGLIGLFACVGRIVQQAFKSTVPSQDNDGQTENFPHESAWSSPGVWGAGLAFPLSTLGLEFVGQGTDVRLWWLGGIWWSVWLAGWLWSRRVQAFSKVALDVTNVRLPMALEAATVALLVHLMGAGGIAMPAITQLWWLIWSLRTSCAISTAGLSDEKSPSELLGRSVMARQLTAVSGLLAAVGLSLCCWWTATMPELLCRTSLQAGDFEWGRRQVEAAQARYHDAAQADPRAIEPLERLAEVAFQQWRTTGRDQNFDEATQRLAVLTTALPFASRFHRRLGQAWLARFNRSKIPDHAQQAVKAFDSAVECYPHHAELLSEWAIACDGAGQREKAREAARQAIHQDNLNRQAGHSDKFLSADTRQRMEHLAD